MKQTQERKFYITLDEILLVLIIAAALGYFVFAPMRNATTRHIFVLFGTVGCYLIAARQIAVRYLEARKLAVIGGIGLIMFFSVLFYRGDEWFDLLYACAGFLTLVILFVADTRPAMSERIEKMFFAAALAIAALLTAAYFGGNAYVFEDGKMTGALVLGMTNPNLTAMFISGSYCILLIRFRKNKKQFLVVPVLLWLLYMLYLTESRSSLICTLLVTAYAMVLYNRKLPQFLVVVSTLTPVAFVPIYLAGVHSRLAKLTILGKPFFSGREELYMRRFSILETPLQKLFGDLGSEQFSNAHNAPLSILCSIGAVGLCLFLYGCTVRLLTLNRNASSAESRIAVACLLSVFIQSSAEALMLVGNFPAMFFLYAYLLMAQSGRADAPKPELQGGAV